ncbi:MAG: TolC family protein [Bacteroidales bacterium]|nr:TolC family protein [Bacteroidales bacterium]
MRLIKVFILLFLASATFAQDVPEDLIKTGLESNIVLKQKANNYQKSLYALKEAKGFFLPSLSLNARYSIADGGRTIYLPVGDMLNPVYYTLNKISSRMYELGVADEVFPLLEIENEEINFLRPTEQETKLQLVQPILNPQIYFNNKIKASLVEAEFADVNTYKRQLVADIKTAWLNYVSCLEILKLIDETQVLLEENLRVNRKLVENDKATNDAVYLAKSEISKLDEMRSNTIMQKKTAEAYINFLLNREPGTEISIIADSVFEMKLVDLESAKSQAAENRDELDMLEAYRKAAAYNLKLNSNNKLPVIFGVADYGFQGEEYKFTDKDDFAMVSFVLKWDLFTGFQKNQKINQVNIDYENIELQQEEALQRINLQVINSYYRLESAVAKIVSAEQRVEYSEKAYNIVNKKYKEGQANLLEFMAARNEMTEAKQNLVLSKLNYKIQLVDFERVTASYKFNETENDEQ